MRPISHFTTFSGFGLLLVISFTLPMVLKAMLPSKKSTSLLIPPEETVVARGPSWIDEANLFEKSVDRRDGPPIDFYQDEEEFEGFLDKSPKLDVLELSPGFFIEYIRFGDSLHNIQTRKGAGAYFYISSHTRFQASGNDYLVTFDPNNMIERTALGLEAAHRLGRRLLLQEGVFYNTYDNDFFSIDDSINWYARADWAIVSNLFFGLSMDRFDVLERGINIIDKLRLFSVTATLFYQFLDRWWVSELLNWGRYTDDNKKWVNNGELGYDVWPKKGMSAIVGYDTTQFSETQDTYWSPSYYHLVYGKLRWTKRFEQPLFPTKEFNDLMWKKRWGYLAEATAGVNNKGYPETIVEGGVHVLLTNKLSLRWRAYHFTSKDRFNTDYHESFIQGRAVFSF